MKIKNILLLSVLAGAMITTGCKKSYLETHPTEYIAFDQFQNAVKKDPALLNGTISGLYSTMFQVGSGGTTGHDDMGQKGYDIYSDMLSGDMALIGVTYGWYSTIVRFQATADFTRNEAYAPWRYYYRVIFGSNNVLDLLGGDSTEQTETIKRHMAGQALAMRAYGYFYLSQLYAREYGDGSAKILPIYHNASQPNQPKSTAQQVWDMMIADLEKAIEYLSDFERSTKDQIDVTVAKGLLSYVLAARGTPDDLARVVTLTDDILADNVLTTPAEVTGGFNDVNTPSWIWGVDITLANGLDLISWWGQVDYYTYSYASVGDAKVLDKLIQDAIRPDDVRKNQWHSTGRPLNKFYDPRKVPQGQRYITCDYIYMRTDEFLLLNAESKARLGQDGPARDALKQLLDIRITDYSYVDALSGTALIDEIYFQERLELWGEGKSYLAMKRLKKSNTRGPNHLYNAGNTYAYNAPELTFPIPQAEVLNNPVLNN